MASFRNFKCKCGSGKKYKKCCLYKEQGYVQVNGSWERAVQLQGASYNLGTTVGGK